MPVGFRTCLLKGKPLIGNLTAVEGTLQNREDKARGYWSIPIRKSCKAWTPTVFPESVPGVVRTGVKRRPMRPRSSEALR